jgi:hypothetical protein
MNPADINGFFGMLEMTPHAARIKREIEALNSATPFKPYRVKIASPDKKMKVDVNDPEEIKVFSFVTGGYFVMFPKVTREGRPDELANRYILQVRPDQIVDVYCPGDGLRELLKSLFGKS